MFSNNHSFLAVLLGSLGLTVLFILEAAFATALDAVIRHMQRAGVDEHICRLFKYAATVIALLACVGIVVVAYRHFSLLASS